MKKILLTILYVFNLLQIWWKQETHIILLGKFGFFWKLNTPSVSEWLVDCWCAVINKVVEYPYCYIGNPDHLAEECALEIHHHSGTEGVWRTRSMSGYKYASIKWFHSFFQLPCITLQVLFLKNGRRTYII